MFVLCALLGLANADQRFFLPHAVAPGQRTTNLRHGQRLPVNGAAYMHPGLASEHVGFGPAVQEGIAAGEMQRVVPVDAPPQMPSTWVLTGALLGGFSVYAVLAVAGKASPPAQPRSSTISMGLEVGDQFPPSALQKCGVSGKNAVVFFYGADDAPSCSKEISAFEANLDTFQEYGVEVVGVRNGKGVKETTDTPVKLVVDEDDEMREEIGIEKDLFGFLGGRETYVVDKSGTVVSVHNNQFDPNSHVDVAVGALDELPQSTNPIEAFLANFNK